jgi:hypothetical protein
MSGVFTLVNVATGKCLDSNAAQKVYSLDRNYGNHQRWNVIQHGGYANIVNQATGNYLDSNGNGNVYAIGGNGGNFQKWRVEGLGNDKFILTDVATGLVLASVWGGGILAQGRHGG